MHVTHDAAPAEDDDPAVQPTQSAFAPPPLLGFAVPAEHSIHVAAEVAFVAVLYFPELHSLQADAKEADHVPGLQSAHDPAFATDECPATQPLQTVALEAANDPALQSPHTEAASLSEN